MCTVTYIPSSNGFIFTSSRDENPGRAKETLPPASYTTPEGARIFPKDPQGGTWFGLSDNGKLHCLLNGAFERHKHQPPYRKSRGLVLLESLSWNSDQEFSNTYDFTDIEPFTMVMLDRSEGVQLSELRWDGSIAHFSPKNNSQPFIWSSAALYLPDIIRKREQVFLNWLQEVGSPIHEDVINLHLNGSIGDPENDFRMNRNGMVQTVSITQLTSTEKKEKLHYRDLLTDKLKTLDI